MAPAADRNGTYPVGIDLGTTYSSLAYLTPQGTPVTIPNSEGELFTPSVILFDDNEVVVGTEALRNSITVPERVVQHAKRYMGDPHKCWIIDGKVLRPKDIATFILRKLLHDAEETLGKVRHAVITVPAQFSELQRRDTVEAGLAAGLEQVDIIHEPVAACLCYVLGEGLWFAELANDQTVLVFDLGGGTLDLSLVKYNQKEVRVIASGGDLMLGGLDWNLALQNFVCDEFFKVSGSDPRLDRESMQALVIEIEQAKRSLSVRPKSPVHVQHSGRRKILSIDREQFEELTTPLVARAERIARDLLKENKMGWANVDAILATGGSTRMPMIRNMLRRIGGTTLNQSLSPDQSICHGAAYYAGMLMSGRRQDKSVLDPAAAGRLAGFRQQSVSGRSLGIVIRDPKTDERRPQYLLPANTPLPCAYRQRFGTVIPHQRKVHLQIIESGAAPSDPWVELGECIIEDLPEDLPISSPIEVTIRYDEQARVHVEAVVISSGQVARVTLVRPPLAAPPAAVPPAAAPKAPPVARGLPKLPPPLPTDANFDPFALPTAARTAAPARAEPTPATVQPVRPAPKLPEVRPIQKSPPIARGIIALEESERPIPLCNHCGETLDARGYCARCRKSGVTAARPGERKRKTPPIGPPVKTGEDLYPTESIIFPNKKKP